MAFDCLLNKSSQRDHNTNAWEEIDTIKVVIDWSDANK